MHSKLVQLAKKWLIGKGYCVIAVETKCTREEPDVIAWDRTGDKTVVLECKSNYEDFERDRRKFFRRLPVFGMGDYRYYFVPKGMVRIGELPDGWGLVEYSEGKCFKVVRESKRFQKYQSALEDSLFS